MTQNSKERGIFMSLMSGLYMMGSGLKAAQQGLYVTSHNMSNSETEGYSRQRVHQADSFYSNIGNGMKVGSGVDIKKLEQIRDEFLDISYREESPRASYHSAIYETIDELFTVMGEINGESITGEMKDLWESMNALSNKPEDIDVRSIFLNSAVKFSNKANYLHDKIVKYQYDLNDKIKSEITEINKLAAKISNYNNKIADIEMTKDQANDYRDQRNLLLDELSTYGKIDVKENSSGKVTVYFENSVLVDKEGINTLGLRYLNDANGQSFVEPVWTSSKDILSKENTSAKSLYPAQTLQSTSIDAETDKGSLRAFLVARGPFSADASTNPDDIRGFLIPTVQNELDILITNITKMINKTVNPADPTNPDNSPYDLHGNQPKQDIFVKINDNDDFTFGNLKINDKLLDDPSMLALAQKKGDISDNTLIQKMLTEWKSETTECDASSKKLNYEDYYAELVGRLGTKGQTSYNILKNQNSQLNDIQYKRETVMSVSMDEEMTKMITYQHAYNASAKVYNVIDSMIQSILSMV